MTQRIFDIENEKDYADLWNIVPENVYKLIKDKYQISYCDEKGKYIFTVPYSLIKINWNNKTEITRQIQEATEADIGKICKFWSGKDFTFGILKEIGDHSNVDVYLMDNSVNGIWFIHCRRLTKQEIEELC